MYHAARNLSNIPVIFETLRKYLPVLFLIRKSISSYTFNGIKASISKGQKVWIPIFALQHDTRIYPEPDVFNPERFNEEAVQNKHPMSFLSFGDGPERNCIGACFTVY
ncbi:PREDICTED: probable cytochrome P450 6a14 [Trachymyrmex cornetzi]|uniref:probable cytochrome P450 6a14 n=1 Tax=Trachymyrmex cornetzi TaxID=471704 RepID=UPI00084F06CE|nr:PREDICTED: probable cytochrome P450 6a14 [Trachymyrmex cornetzi]